MLADCIIGLRLFVDGVERDAFEDVEGQQYVEDDGQQVYGQWLPPADEAVIVAGV